MKESFKISIPTVISFLITYTTISGCLWHLGYWSTFKFNFLEFANVSDIFKSTIYPFFSNIWFYLVLILFSFALSYGATFHLVRKPLQNENNEPSEKIRKTINILIALCGILIFIFSGFLFSGKIVWTILPFAAGFFIGCILFQFNLFKNQVKDSSFRLVILIVISLFPSLNFGIAKRESLQIHFMIRYKQVTDIIATDTALSKSILNTAYLGSTNTNYFFYTPNKVIIVKSANILSFAIKDTIDAEMYNTVWEKY